MPDAMKAGMGEILKNKRRNGEHVTEFVLEAIQV